jgi:hypothetical protein
LFVVYYLHGVTIKDTIFIRIVEVHVFTKGEDEMAQVTDGFLKVIGRPTPAELCRNHQPTRMTNLSRTTIYIFAEKTHSSTFTLTIQQHMMRLEMCGACQFIGFIVPDTNLISLG